MEGSSQFCTGSCGRLGGLQRRDGAESQGSCDVSQVDGMRGAAFASNSVALASGPFEPVTSLVLLGFTTSESPDQKRRHW